MEEEGKISQEVNVPQEESRSGFGLWGVALIILVCAVVVSLGFVVHEHGVAKQLSTQNSAMTASLQQTRGQLDDLNAKLSQLTAAQAAAEAAKAERSASGRHPRAVRRDDPRWKKVQDELAEHQKAIESTQSDLADTRTELSGGIARTHEEVVALAKKGERNYYEFDLNKSKQFERKGPIGISLRKANAKHDYADLALLVDDATLTKKHVNMFEPVMFYSGESKQPVELVINQVTRDHIHGYVSTPKYKTSDLPALSGLTDSQSSTAAQTANTSSDSPALRNR
jgi:hypothetical protein